MKKFLKIIHTLSSIAFASALTAHLIILFILPDPSEVNEYVLLRNSITTIDKYLLIPSFAIVLLSGLFSLALHRPFHNAGWVWAKALIGLLMFEWVLMGVSGPAQKVDAMIKNNNFDHAAHLKIAGQEQTSIYIMLGLVAANVIIGVWRLRFSKRRSKLSE